MTMTEEEKGIERNTHFQRFGEILLRDILDEIEVGTGQRPLLGGGIEQRVEKACAQCAYDFASHLAAFLRLHPDLRTLRLAPVEEWVACMPDMADWPGRKSYKV